jgi:hypothetical protein
VEAKSHLTKRKNARERLIDRTELAGKKKPDSMVWLNLHMKERETQDIEADFL